MDKKSNILISARELFLEQGYQSTSIQSIATKAGISKGAIYLYFKSKEDILLAIFRMLEEKVWSKISEINRNDALSPQEKYRQQIITFYNEIIENLQFNQMMLSDSGVALNEDFYNYAREYRYRLQKAQEESLLNIYGDKLKPWLADIVVSVNGILQELDASIVLDGLEINSGRLSDFVCQLTRFLVDGMVESKPEPLFTKENLNIREEFLAKIKNEKQYAIIQQYMRLVKESESLTLEGESLTSLEETLELLKDTLQQSPHNKTLAKALLLNLGEYSELKVEREKLSNLLEIRIR